MRQLLTYFALAYLISWAIWLPLYGHVFGLNNLPTLPFHHGLGGLGPLTASFITTWIYSKNQGLRQLLKKCFQVQPLIYLMIALLSPFILAIAASVINYFIDKTPITLAGLLATKEFPDFNLLTFFIYNLVFFGFGEEVGWRGFVLPRLQNKLNALSGAEPSASFGFGIFSHLPFLWVCLKAWIFPFLSIAVTKEKSFEVASCGPRVIPRCMSETCPTNTGESKVFPLSMEVEK